MNNKQQKLELTWIGKGEEPKLEPRILIEHPEYSYGDLSSDNLLIQGDNLLALKALEQDYAGKIKCIFIDPPYNTGSAFEHYDDGVEHSIWLNLIRHRLRALWSLLQDDGSIWVAIDDNEGHYLKLVMDEIYGRHNFVASIIWEKVYSERMDSKGFSTSHDYIIVYQKTSKFKVRKLRANQNKKQFNYYDKETQKYYRRRSLRKEGSASLRIDRPSMWYEIISPTGELIYPYKPDGTEGRWRWGKEKIVKNRGALEFVYKDNKWEIYVKQYLDDAATRPPTTLWRQEDVGHNHEAKEEVKVFNKTDVFSTPKPERLISKILKIASSRGDLVLDSFLGSGTTAAVAHKMGRRWIGVEIGEHAKTHCYTRLKAVVDGEQGGISKFVDWKGGGGFKFYTLAPSLLNQDRYGNWIISTEYNPAMLAAAMAKQEGFRYQPDEHVYWKQGKSSEKDYIYTTTQFITTEMIDRIHDEMKPDESLLIACKAFHKEAEHRCSNISIKKIPTMLLGRCEFGREDYSLNIVNLPSSDDDQPPDVLDLGTHKSTLSKKKGSSDEQQTLFSQQ